MSPAQAELEDNQIEIERLTGELATCRMELTDALGAVEMSRETITLLREEVTKAREETAQVYAACQAKIKKLRDQVSELQTADGQMAESKGTTV